MTFLRPAAAIVALGVILGGTACTGDEKADGDTATTTTTVKKKKESSAADQASSKVNLDKLLTMDAEWSLFNEGVVGGKAKELLGGKGPYTLFIPPSASFGDRGVNSLGSTPDALAEGARRHIVEGKLTLADLAALDGKTVTTLSGDKLKVAIVDGVMTIGGVKLIKNDISAKNGMIHVTESIIPAPK